MAVTAFGDAPEAQPRKGLRKVAEAGRAAIFARGTAFLEGSIKLVTSESVATQGGRQGSVHEVEQISVAVHWRLLR